MASSGLRGAWLFAFNCANLLGWAVVLFLTVTRGVDAAVWSFVCYLQAFGSMEIAHTALGWVGGSIGPTILQNGGRNLTLGSVWLTGAYDAVFGSRFTVLLFIVWSSAELIRYPFYITTSLGNCPSLIKWLRYSGFLVLYPVGFMGEVSVFVNVFGELAAKLTVTMPNEFNAAFDGQLGVGLYLLLAYGIGGPVLYYSMVRSRRKRLGKARAAKDSAKTM